MANNEFRGGTATVTPPQPNATQQASSVLEDAKGQAKDLASQAKDETVKMAGQARDQITQAVSEREDQAANRLGGLAGALRDTAQKLQQEDASGFGRYADQAAEQVDRFSRYLKVTTYAASSATPRPSPAATPTSSWAARSWPAWCSRASSRARLLSAAAADVPGSSPPPASAAPTSSVSSARTGLRNAATQTKLSPLVSEPRPTTRRWEVESCRFLESKKIGRSSSCCAS